MEFYGDILHTQTRTRVGYSCGATADPSTHFRGTPPGVGGGHLGQEKTLGHLKECFYWPGHFRDVHTSVSAILLERLLPLDKELPLGILLLGTPCIS